MLVYKYLRAFGGTLVSFLGGLGGVLLSVIAALRPDLATPWLFWFGAGACFVVASFEVWRHEHQRVEELEQPKIEILLEEGRQPYIHDDESARLVRVGVKNVSGRTINHIAVDLTYMTPCTISEYLPLSLRHTHRDYQPSDPGQTRMIDVAYKLQFEDLIEIFPHAELGQRVLVPADFYRITLSAHGEHCACDGSFRLEVDRDGLLSLKRW